MWVCQKVEESAFGRQGVVEDDQAPRIVQPLDPITTTVLFVFDKHVLDVSSLEIFTEILQ